MVQSTPSVQAGGQVSTGGSARAATDASPTMAATAVPILRKSNTDIATPRPRHGGKIPQTSPRFR